MEAVFRDVVTEQRQQRELTVLLSSHILSKVEVLCDRVTILRAGRTVESGSLDELRHLTRTTIEAELANPPQKLDGAAGVHNLRTEAGKVKLDVDAEALDEVLRVLAAAGVRSLVSQPPTLEQLFLQHYQQRDHASTAVPEGR